MRENGNVLFLILIAVALFAAVSYAVTSSTRSGGANTDKEKASLLSGQITQYGATLQTAYLRLKISNNCADDQISYENPFNSIDYINATAPADKSCHMFHAGGGGVSPLVPNIIDPAQASVPNNQWQFLITQSTGGFGSSTDDLIAYAKLGSKAMCEEINLKINGVTPVPTVNIALLATGNFPHTAFNANFGSLQGKSVGCFYTNHVYSDGYWFYQVLETR